MFKTIDSNKEKYDTEFIEHVGCSVEVMSIVDSMYSDLEHEYREKKNNLDKKFGILITKRKEYHESLKNCQRAQ